ncbi:MAG: aminotransferase class V-fold PLP-dependent enzyme [Ignavibacteria bacterium]|jgi:selenocysteine lyase/cysteine desulfurase|nr:aminotransferase class V-fold PLP-dependent enzyme [Ignavibacteria bacterium]
MQDYFEKFRQNTIGHNLKYTTVYGEQRLIYADWVASGRLYKPIEDTIINSIGPFVANTHTETSETGTLMTNAYRYAHRKIKEHCNAGEKDVIISAGSGMTTVINKFQRMLGLKHYNKLTYRPAENEPEKPVVFITHMEHHSNQTSWYETSADVVVVPPGDDLLVDLNNLEAELIRYKDRKIKYGSFTACSNVTGIQTPYHAMAKLMHKYGGYCFVDFAASAPYVDINMHPEDEEEYLDAVFFSPHKFLGGPGSSGVLIFNSELYRNYSPDHPGGGTVEWTNPWGEYKYIDDIEIREDGGTPGFIQAIRTALCAELKNGMNVNKMAGREEVLVKKAFDGLSKIPGLHILADNVTNRLGIISFYVDNLHYNLIVRLLSDRFGVQVRGGCACAGTYGHYLLNVDYGHSKRITELINLGDLSLKPGWVRLSLHPTMTDEDLDLVIYALEEIVKNQKEWKEDYVYDKYKNEFFHKTGRHDAANIKTWFVLP